MADRTLIFTLIGSGRNDLPGIFAPTVEDRGCEDSRSSGAAGDSVRQAPAAHRELESLMRHEFSNRPDSVQQVCVGDYVLLHW